ncbi:MAG: hypothetical protein ACI9UA_000682 [Pseudoalteromonas tetraodonis]|jgi:hypothetical protein
MLSNCVACAQEKDAAAPKPEPKETAADKSEREAKDPNAKPNIPKNAAVDAIVWGAVVYAKADGKAQAATKELPDLEKRLGKIKGFEAYKSFEVIGQHTQKVFSEYTNWLVPSKELFLNIDSKGPAADGGMNLHVQLWRRTKVLVKTDTTLKKGSPLIIGGPKWRDGQLIFVLLLKEDQLAAPAVTP